MDSYEQLELLCLEAVRDHAIVPDGCHGERYVAEGLIEKQGEEWKLTDVGVRRLLTLTREWSLSTGVHRP